MLALHLVQVQHEQAGACAGRPYKALCISDVPLSAPASRFETLQKPVSTLWLGTLVRHGVASCDPKRACIQTPVWVCKHTDIVSNA